MKKFSLNGFLKTYYLQKRLEQQIQREFSFFLDHLALSMQTGLGLESALLSVSEKQKDPLKRFLKSNLEPLSRRKSFSQVLQSLGSSLNSLDWKNTWLMIEKSQKMGFPLSPILILSADLLRQKRRQRAEELSRSASIKITLPLVLCFFPSLLLLYLGPGVIRLLQ